MRTLYEVRFQVVKVAPQGSAITYQYRRETQKVFALASSGHDVVAVLNRNIAIAPEESIEIIGALPVGEALE